MCTVYNDIITIVFLFILLLLLLLSNGLELNFKKVNSFVFGDFDLFFCFFRFSNMADDDPWVIEDPEEAARAEADAAEAAGEVEAAAEASKPAAAAAEPEKEEELPPTRPPVPRDPNKPVLCKHWVRYEGFFFEISLVFRVNCFKFQNYGQNFKL